MFSRAKKYLQSNYGGVLYHVLLNINLISITTYPVCICVPSCIKDIPFWTKILFRKSICRLFNVKQDNTRSGKIQWKNPWIKTKLISYRKEVFFIFFYYLFVSVYINVLLLMFTFYSTYILFVVGDTKKQEYILTILGDKQQRYVLINLALRNLS